MCECKDDKCLLMAVYPNTNANVACDCDCYLTYQKENVIERYKKEFPKQFKDCVKK